jgi:release factor glutamine methyltransferase
MFNHFIQAYNVFNESGVDNPLLETLRLFDLLSGNALRKMDLYPLTEKKIDLADLAQKRKEGMPLEYIIKMATFMGLAFYCSSGALIPREETELLAKVTIDLIKERQGIENNLIIVDVGTGCGNIAVSLAMNSEHTKILAVDISQSAIEIAQKNVNKFNLQQRISLFCGDLFSPINDLGYEEKIDVIVCNPPYIPTGSLSKLAPEIIDHEPKVALDAGPFGINFYRRLINDSLSILKPNGILVFEIGVGQEKLVARLLEKKEGYKNIVFFDDGLNVRVIKAVKSDK